MMISQTRRVYWTIARQMGPEEWYVDRTERYHYDNEQDAQIESDALNLILQVKVAQGDPVMNPDAKFMPVKITQMECIQT